jgi:UPF0271 protein
VPSSGCTNTLDLNADLGEGVASDAELLALVTSASVACGVHAGDPAIIAATLSAAASRGVSVGAHPSYWDREHFGREPLDVDRDRLAAELVYQIGAVSGLARAAGTHVRYVKAHGALYNRAAIDKEHAGALIEAAATFDLPLLCPPSPVIARLAAVAHVDTFTEGFADRRYQPDGSLVSRKQPGAVITDPAAVVAQALSLAIDRTVTTLDGTRVEVQAMSICLHGDTPGAVALAVEVRRALEAEGVLLSAFA